MQIDETHQRKCMYYANIANKVHPYFLISNETFSFLWYFSLNTKLILCKRNMILLAVNFWVHPFIISRLSYLLNHFLYYIDQILNQSSFSVIKPDFFFVGPKNPTYNKCCHTIYENDYQENWIAIIANNNIQRKLLKLRGYMKRKKNV